MLLRPETDVPVFRALTGESAEANDFNRDATARAA
jgi:hypothetical protein